MKSQVQVSQRLLNELEAGLQLPAITIVLPIATDLHRALTETNILVNIKIPSTSLCTSPPTTNSEIIMLDTITVTHGKQAIIASA